MAETASTTRDRDDVIGRGARRMVFSRIAHPGRKSIRSAAVIVVATLLLELAGLASWWAYSEWRLGRIELTNDGPMLTVQVLDEPGEHPLGEPVEVFKKWTLALPDGDYRLRVDREAVGSAGPTASPSIVARRSRTRSRWMRAGCWGESWTLPSSWCRTRPRKSRCPSRW